MIIEFCAAFLLLAGAGFIFVAALGVARFPDLFTRMHAASKAVTLGLGCMLLGVAVLLPSAAVFVKVSAVILFIFLTIPVAAHMLGRAGYLQRTPLWPGTRFDDLKGRYEKERGKLR